MENSQHAVWNICFALFSRMYGLEVEPVMSKNGPTHGQLFRGPLFHEDGQRDLWYNLFRFSFLCSTYVWFLEVEFGMSNMVPHMAKLAEGPQTFSHEMVT